ncbi:carbonic anhydrase [Stachybotrys elegans]|uniref:Carbonic anhydrase n=1 Tax=Stachybotrys elegans TaxID=80388 RepID=A0A8K0SF21_9HYPO|nr:carbonic anhydrase [Stachybotrys elegans]
MAEKITVEELLARNKIVMASHTPAPTFQFLAENQIAVAKTLVVACVDPRSDPSYILGLKFGEAGILRNIGGQVKPLLNDILALDNLITFEQVMIIHHTDCGSTHFTNEQVRGVLTQRDPQAAAEMNVESVDFGAVSNLPDSVVRDVKFLKEHKLMREELKENIKGYLYDIEKGSLEEISG